MDPYEKKMLKIKEDIPVRGITPQQHSSVFDQPGNLRFCTKPILAHDET